MEAIGGILGVYGQVLTRRFPPMALSQSVASEVLEASRAGEGVDLIRESVRPNRLRQGVLHEMTELTSSPGAK